MKSRRGKPRSRPTTRPSADPIELSVHGTIHDGRGLAHHGGKAVFVSGALEGETVLARLVNEQSRFCEARTLEVIEPSSQRVAPPCVHFGRCGGCQLQHMAEQTQHAVKQDGLLDQLRRRALELPAPLLPPLTGEPWGYRSRARLGVQFDKTGRVSLGFRQARDKVLVDLQQCPVLAPPLAALLAPLRAWLQEQALTPVTHVDFIQAEAVTALVIRHTQALPASALKTLTEWSHAQGATVWLQPAKDPMQLLKLAGEPVDPRLRYCLADGALSLGFHPSDFTQINPAINRAMIDQALELLAPQPHEHLLDLFCGIGNFSLPMARLAGRVSGVEAVEAMVARGRENAAYNGLGNLSFFACDLTREPMGRLLGKTGQIDTLLLDPPRAGAREICEQLGGIKSVGRILYVSCDSATFVRDTGILTQQGYRLTQLGTMEMFPQTSHLEIMALFTRQ